MRRPPIACRRAVHSLTTAPPHHIWISDDLLSRAIDQFFRPTRSHQKRHGSHVPGPLEARRRAAKRRMTAHAAFQPQDALSPPLFSLAALFGSRVRGEPSWKYEPPSLKQTVPFNFPLDTVPSQSHTNLVFKPPPPIPIPLADHRAAVNSNSVKPGVSHAQNDHDTVFLSRSREWNPTVERGSGFAVFKMQIAPATTLSESDRYQLLLSAIQRCHPGTDDKGRFSLLVLRHLLEEGWMAGHIALCFSKPYVRLPDVYTTDGVELLTTLATMYTPGFGQIRGIGRLYEKLAESARTAPVSSCRAEDTGMHLLIRGLWDTSRSHGEVVAGPAVGLLLEVGGKLSDQRLLKHLHPILRDTENANKHVASLLTTCTRKPGLMQMGVDVLSLVPRTLVSAWIASLPTFLFKSAGTGPSSKLNDKNLRNFETWIKLIHKLDGCSNTPGAASLSDLAFSTQVRLFMDRDSAVMPAHSLVIALLYKLAGHTSLAQISTDRLFTFIASYAPSLLRQHEIALPFNEMLARLILSLEEASLPNHGVIELMVPSINQYKGTLAVADLLRRVQTHGSTLSSTASLHNLVLQILGQIETVAEDLRTERERQHNAYALHCCQKLRKLVMSLGARVHAQGDQAKALVARRQFHHILDRARDARIVPLAYRDVPANLPAYQKGKLIHQFAHQYSISRTRTHRQNWRSMYYLYRYLVNNNLRIDAVFTKAVVRTCITHPLSENHFVSSRRLIWVCQLVARVEGEEVARRIEQVFWAWRGDLILHSKKMLVAMGSNERAHVSTMKRLGMI